MGSFLQNSRAFNIKAETELAVILSHFDESYVYNVMDDNINMLNKRFNSIPLPNITNSFEDNFKAKWNLDGDKIWAINEKSFEEVGCIHTAQGLEFDYVGVIIGNDLRYDEENGKVITDKTKVSKDDKSSGIRSADDLTAESLIKNTYKTLLTRGQKGCYVYCEDVHLREYIEKLLDSNKN